MPRRFSTFRPHPWHGLPAGDRAPAVVEAYIEITPFDVIKYEIDKHTGYLRVDRPLRTSSTPPTLYGFIPRTYCGPRVAALSPGASRGDGDPLDVCVVSERPITRNEVVLSARVVGGLRMLDAGEADDKVVAVLESDAVWSEVRELSELPSAMVDRLRHYFATYKLGPTETTPVAIAAVYDAAQARQVVEEAMRDYEEEFGE
jgi:inorganic pyrophosphatase